MITPSEAEAKRLIEAGYRVPIWLELLADLETPTSAYWKLAHEADHSFLLESVTGGERLARYSFLGANPTRVARTSDLNDLRDELRATPYRSSPALPPFAGGFVGVLSYDLVRQFEKLPDENTDDLAVDDICMMLFEQVVAFDHAKNRILIIDHASPTKPYSEAVAAIRRTADKLAAPMPAMPAASSKEASFSANVSRDAFEASVARTIEYIRAGDGVQMVLSQRFSSPADAHPVSMYRALRFVNPSPYMFLVRCGDYDAIGASPEALVTVTGSRVRVRPIAGTRPRGADDAEDVRLEAELLADEKERAEHVMLVDLGRNDVGRIAKAGSVKVGELMQVERYSHVMHIVSEVTGELKDGLDCFDAVRACFPAGTVSGAPKVRAMEIIDELETTRRGVYAGAVGYFGYDGDMDLAIAIRTILLKDGMAHVQAGAGIVFDSVPEREWEECRAKAAAVIRAVEIAQAGEML